VKFSAAAEMVCAAFVLHYAGDGIARRVQSPQTRASDVELDRAIVEYLLEFLFSRETVAFMTVANLHQPLVPRRERRKICRIKRHQAVFNTACLARKYEKTADGSLCLLRPSPRG
jgi:hypothetical protein